MYFRAIALIVASSAVVGCSLSLNEKPPENPVIELGDDMGCMAGGTQKIKDYIDGQSDDATISKLVQCTSKALQLFSERTRGSDPGKYKPDELEKFLERYFLAPTKFPAGLMTEIMELKKLFLGGQSDS